MNALAEYKPKTAFDVEDRAMDVILSNIGNEMFNGVKNYIYYSPETRDIQMGDDTVTVKISMPPILRAMSIYLRDKYFEGHPDIEDDDWRNAISNIDKE